MDCDNKFCYWNLGGETCVSESLGENNKQEFKPNYLDCPMTLRRDFEVMLWDMYDALRQIGYNEKELGRMNFRTMYELLII